MSEVSYILVPRTVTMSVKAERRAISGVDAATILGVTYDNVRRHHKKGNLKGFWIDTVLWIYEDSLEEFKENRTPRGRPRDVVSAEPPKNRALRSKYFRGSKRRKTKADKLAAAEREREYQRQYQRERRERLKQEREAALKRKQKA